MVFMIFLGITMYCQKLGFSTAVSEVPETRNHIPSPKASAQSQCADWGKASVG